MMRNEKIRNFTFKQFELAVVITYSRFLRISTARGSCGGVPLRYKTHKSLLFTKHPSVDERKKKLC